MALSNKDRIGRALDLLEEGLFPFVKAQFEAAYGKDWEKKAQESIPELKRRAKTEKKWDVQILLSAIQNNWTQIFGETLGRTERSIVNELRDVRNEWAHQGAFVLDDTYRALDSMQRLLTAIAAPQAQEVEKHKKEILRLRYEEEAKRELKSATQVALEGSPQKGLKPWRMVMIPHEDVRRGTFQQAEFAADLWAVHNKSAAAEYGEPIQFFERTFPTQGLRQLLTNALRRLTGNGGDPVIELQTSFGGGKTHSMLALYHLLSGVLVTSLTYIVIDGFWEMFLHFFKFCSLRFSRKELVLQRALRGPR